MWASEPELVTGAVWAKESEWVDWVAVSVCKLATLWAWATGWSRNVLGVVAMWAWATVCISRTLARAKVTGLARAWGWAKRSGTRSS